MAGWTNNYVISIHCFYSNISQQSWKPEHWKCGTLVLFHCVQYINLQQIPCTQKWMKHKRQLNLYSRIGVLIWEGNLSEILRKYWCMLTFKALGIRSIKIRSSRSSMFSQQRKINLTTVQHSCESRNSSLYLAVPFSSVNLVNLEKCVKKVQRKNIKVLLCTWRAYLYENILLSPISFSYIYLIYF